MAVTIKLRRGRKQDLPPEASDGEALVTIDSGEIFLGMGAGQPLKAIGGSGGGSSGTIIDDEDLSIYVNGQRDTFKVQNSRYLPGSLKVFVNGMRLRKSALANTYHFTETDPGSGEFKVSDVMAVGTIMIVEYRFV